jgi:hypothetical protein
MSHVPYASVVGSLMFAMACSRLDIVQAVRVGNKHMVNLSRDHWAAVKWILCNLKDVICYGG